MGGGGSIVAGFEASAAVAAWSGVWGICFALVHSIAVIVLNLEHGKKSERYANRVVSFIHSSLLVLLTAPIVFLQDGQGLFTFRGFGGPNSEQHNHFLAICAGYMLFDICFEVYQQVKGGSGIQEAGAALYIHHILVCSTCWFSLIQARFGPELAVTTLLSEATTPFLNLKFLMKKHGVTGDLALANDAVFAFGFLFLRIFWGSFVLRGAVMMSHNMHWYVRFGGYAMTMINYVWGYGIAKKIYAKVRKARKGKKSKTYGDVHRKRSKRQSKAVIHDPDSPLAPNQLKEL